MERLVLALIVSIFTLPIFAQENSDKNARIGVLARQYIHVPIEKAHVSSGNTFDRDFNPKSIKVFVWNIKKTEMPNWKDEFNKFGRNQDLVLIQEAYKNELFNSTLNSFQDMRWDMAISFLYRRDNNTASGTMIGSKVEPSQIIVKQTVDFEPVVDTPKTMTIGKYPIEGLKDELMVISIHGINITSLATFKRHMLQAKEEILKHNGPVLFAGDFNSRTNARIRYMLKIINELKFTPIEFKNGHRRMAWKFTNNYLDWGFVRGLTVKNAEVIVDSRGSDHKPMTFEVSIP